MHIIEANKFYWPKGGAERYMLALEGVLQDHGHKVTPFAMQDPRNLSTEWSRFFVSPVGTERVSFSLEGLRTAGRVLYSFEARRRFGELLDETDPSLVHCHNIYHQLSPSILEAAWRRGIPVVLTAHDYAFIAPNYSLFHDGQICDHTAPDRYWRAVPNRCVKDSYAASALEAAAFYLHDALRLWGAVDTVIVPSRFSQAMFTQYGIPEDRTTLVPHFVDTAGITPSFDEGAYVLYAGRLSPEKGVEKLIRAAAHVPHIPFRVVGAGPEEERLRAMAAELGLRNVEFRGERRGEELAAEFSGCHMVAVPSVCYETFGLSCLEAFAYGKPVVASQIGALPELVKDGETGLLASVGDDVDLARQIDALWRDGRASTGMGRAARKLAEQEYNPEKHYDRILGVYRDVMGKAEQVLTGHR